MVSLVWKRKVFFSSGRAGETTSGVTDLGSDESAREGDACLRTRQQQNPMHGKKLVHGCVRLNRWRWVLLCCLSKILRLFSRISMAGLVPLSRFLLSAKNAFMPTSSPLSRSSRMVNLVRSILNVLLFFGVLSLQQHPPEAFKFTL